MEGMLSKPRHNQDAPLHMHSHSSDSRLVILWQSKKEEFSEISSRKMIEDDDEIAVYSEEARHRHTQFRKLNDRYLK